MLASVEKLDVPLQKLPQHVLKLGLQRAGFKKVRQYAMVGDSTPCWNKSAPWAESKVRQVCNVG